VSVISALGDDLDQASNGAARIGLVGTDPSDRGIIGGLWYQGADDDQTAYVPAARQVAAVRGMLSSGYGADAQTDILAVVMRDSLRHMDSELRDVVAMADRAARGALTVVVAGTGSTTRTGDADVPLARVLAPVEAAVPGSSPAVAGAVAGGIFLDQATMAEADVTSNVAVQALQRERAPDGGSLMADAFPSFAVSFGKYCAQVEAAS
jgi:hypothetical protein